jgi:lysozyme
MDITHRYKLAEEIIKKFEGLRLEAYLDIADIPTIGYGNTHHVNGDKIKIGECITQLEAEQMLMRSIITIDNFLFANLKNKSLNENQLAALISLNYNIGMGNFIFSTMKKKIDDSDIEGAANEFERWKWSAGKVVNGLIRRRQAEKELFLS